MRGAGYALTPMAVHPPPDAMLTTGVPFVSRGPGRERRLCLHLRVLSSAAFLVQRAPPSVP